MGRAQVTVNPYDGKSVKGVLDDAAREYVASVDRVDSTLEYTVMFISFVCCVLGALAHYYPVPWPASYYHILAIVASYYALSFVLSYVLPSRYPLEVCRSSSLVLQSRFQAPLYELRANHGDWVKLPSNSFFTSEGLFLRHAFIERLRPLVSKARKAKKAKSKK